MKKNKFIPDIMIDKIWDIDDNIIDKFKIKGFILDIDNTLTNHNDPVPDERVLKWLSDIKNKNMPLIIVSNNREERVSKFADNLSLPFVYKAGKPKSKGLLQALSIMGISKEETAVIGDQIFTDILGGNSAGMITVLVAPFYAEKMLFFKIKRFFEKPFIKLYKKHSSGRR